MGNFLEYRSAHWHTDPLGYGREGHSRWGLRHLGMDWRIAFEGHINLYTKGLLFRFL